MEKHIKLFLEFLQDDKKLSDNTLQSYKRDIEQYRDYIQENRINYLKVDGEDLQEYLKKLQEMGKKTSTISKKFSIYKVFLPIFIKS